MSNNIDVSVVSVHETHKETYLARFYIIYNHTCNHGWNTVPRKLITLKPLAIMLRFNHKQQDL